MNVLPRRYTSAFRRPCRAILPWAVCVAAGCPSLGQATPTEKEVLLDDCRDAAPWVENLGREFPGATGEVGAGTAPDRAKCVTATVDFTTGGRYGGMERVVRIPHASALAFQVWSEGFKGGGVRLRDITNQEHSAGFSVVPGRWCDVRLLLTPRIFGGHWHGADDGRFHWPVRRLLISMHPDGARKGRFFVRNITIRTADPELRWDVRVSTAFPGNIAFLEECPARVTVRVRNRLRQRREAKAVWDVTDTDGRRISAGSHTGAFGPWGAIDVPLKIDPGRPGWYRIRVRILENDRETGQGEGAIGVVKRLPNFGRDDPVSFFGIHASDTAAAARIGVKWTRMQRAWWWGESIKGHPYWPDAGIERARRDHIKIMMTLHYGPPGWAVAEVGEDKAWPPPKKLLDGWAAYVRACVQRYRGKVDCFEIQNEPDLTCWWQRKLSFEDGVRSYVTVFRRAAKEIRRYAPGIPIAGVDVSGGDYRNKLRFSRAVLEEIAPLLDVYTGHPYASPRYFGRGRRPLLPFQNRLTEKLRSSQEMLREFQRPDHVWIGEKGWGLDISEPLDGPYSMAYARCVERALIAGRSVPGVDRWFWFLQNGCNERGYEYGLWRGDAAQPLPAAVAFAAAARFLYHATPAKPALDLPPDLRATLFRCPDLNRAVAVLWSLRDDSRLESDWPQKTAAFDMWGASCGLRGLRISQAPAYLTAPLAAAGRLLRAIENGRFEPARPVRIDSVHLDAIDRLAVTLSNRVPRDVHIEVRAGTRQGEFELPASRSETVYLPLRSPQTGADGKAPPIEIRMLADGRLVWTGQQERSFLPCPRKSGIRIDGKLSEWQGQEVRLDKREFLLPPDPNIGWNGPNDLSVTARWAWDNKAFYLALTVRDDIHAAPFVKPGNFWNSDSIQVAFDPKNDAAPDSEYDGNDREFGCVLTKKGPRVFRTVPGPPRRADFACAIRRQEKDTVYELAVPWAALGVRPKPGRVFSFNFIVNDNDGAGRGYWLGPRPGIGEAKRPARFLDLVFALARRRQTGFTTKDTKSTKHGIR